MLTGTGVGYRNIVSTVDIDVAAGELVAIVGPNGAGKSTLLSLLAGDLTPNPGEIHIGGTPIRRLRPAELARLRAVMPQQSRLDFAFTVREVVGLSGRNPEDALRRVGLTGLADRAYPTLSGGEQARVTFARVLAQDTPVVLLDEPTAHLDIHHQSVVLGLARTVADEGRTVVVVLHDLNLAGRWADRVLVLRGGSVAALGTPADVFTADTLSTVYDHPVAVIPHPEYGWPVALPA